MSLRVKTLLIVLAAMALLSFIVTLITADAIGEVQRQYEEDVKEATRSQLNALQERLQQDLSKAEVDLSSAEGQRLIEGHVSAVFNAADDDVQILITDPMKSRGTLVVSYDRGQVKVTHASGADLDETVQQLAMPLYARGQMIGALSYKINSEKMLTRLQVSSRQIRRSLTGLSVVLMGVMFTTFFLLWKTFKRHIEMTVRASQLRQMAYVGSLAAGLAHEIRNPLHAMGINLSVAEEEVLDPREDSPERVAALVAKLKNQLGGLNATVTNFLEYARPERSSPEALDLVRLVHRVCLGLLPQLEAIGGHLDWRPSPELPPGEEGRVMAVVVGQPASLAQVFTNIVTNAIQAMEEKRQRRGYTDGHPLLAVEIAPRPTGFITVRIADNGPGIKPADLKRVFEVFYSQRPGGSGFGLAIAKRVVTDHGGKIVAESETGRGATFTVAIPAAPPAHDSASLPPTA